MALMQVREAARQLEVHENTLRRWEERGLIRAVRLPSGVRRFRSEDIDRIHHEMYDAIGAEALDSVRERERKRSRVKQVS